MGTHRMENCVRQLYKEVYSKGNINICDECCAKDMKMHDAAISTSIRGIDAFKESEAIYHKAFPNKKANIDDIFVADDRVVVRWSFSGKQDGDLQGIAPTHKTVHIKGISIYRFEEEKISEIWQSWDRLGLLEQLGVIQPAHALHF